ncbi:MAG: hypothetical protein IKR92_03105, partial [Alphaproteobacteria bacterium]|nr:hypothetical protein [Alphaproteobacteria bacterium]
EFIGFNDFWRNFYTKCALKWPLWWSTEWITLDNLKTCGARKQVAYFWGNYYEKNVSWRKMTLEAMSPEAQVCLIRKHFDRAFDFGMLMHLTDDMFEEWLKQLIKKDHKTNHSTIGYSRKLYEPLCDYLTTGKLPFSQVMMLTHAAVAEYGNSSCPVMKELGDYIERFGLRKNQLATIAQYMCDNLHWHDTFGEEPTTDFAKTLKAQDKYNHYYNFLLERQVNFEQRVFTKSQRGDEPTGEWKAFCEKTHYICVAAQKEMDIEQYKMFHATGHTLNKEAIFTLFSHPDRNLHRLVFEFEPLEVFKENALQVFIERNAHLKALFEDKEKICK